MENLTKLHAIRKKLMIWELERQDALERWLKKSTAHIDTPAIRKQAIKKFNENYDKANPKPEL